MENQAVQWLLLEGALPLLGAGILYVLLAFSRWLVSTNKRAFSVRWRPALDSLSWLYGGVIIAVQTGFKGWGLDKAGVLPFVAFIVAGVCFLVTVAAMLERGQTPGWEPPIMMQLFAALMVAGILYAGYETQVILLAVGHD